MRRWVALGALGGLVSACDVAVASGLDEADANRVVVALDRADVPASKDVDPASEGRFRVVVAQGDVAAALGAMREEELPRPRPLGVLDTLDKGSLVPSAESERAQRVAGLAGDLQRSLESVDGVLSARVHLALPSPDPFSDRAPPKATASVLVTHRGATPPITVDAIQRLVAGGVPDVAPADVAVVVVSRPAPPKGADRTLAKVGPIAVSRGSSRALQIALAGLVLLSGALAATVLALVARLAKLRAAASESPEA